MLQRDDNPVPGTDSAQAHEESANTLPSIPPTTLAVAAERKTDGERTTSTIRSLPSTHHQGTGKKEEGDPNL